MAVIELNKNTYTQVNTNATDYTMQNRTQCLVAIVVSDTQPAADADHEFELAYLDGITDQDISAILWAKSINRDTAFVGLKEG